MNLTPPVSQMSRPRQRILQRKHRRLSIRVEEIFWAQLETCAKEEGIKLADLVFALTENLPDTENRSSLLRAYSVDWLRKRLLHARLAATQVDLQLILAACPAPSVIITQQRRLAAYNPAFAAEVLRQLVPSNELRQAENIIRFVLSRPFEAISNALRTEATGYTDSAVVFDSGGKQKRFIGRFCLLNRRPSDGAPLLCYLREDG